MLQWLLEPEALLSPMMVSHSRQLSGALLIVAGVMNLLWIDLLSVFVLTEKLFYQRFLHASASALALITTGLWQLLPA